MSHPDRIVLYDGVCNLCDESVKFIIKHDSKRKFHFAPMQELSGRALLAEYGLEDINLSTFVFIENGKVSTKSTAWMRILRNLDGFWPVLSVFVIVPKFVRDFFYDYVGKNRYRWFGKADSCMMPTADTRARFL